MKNEELLSLVIPLAWFALLAIESRAPARSFEKVPHWRRTGLTFFVMVMIVGSVTPLLLPFTKPGLKPLMDLSALGYWSVPAGLLAVSFAGYWLHRAEHHFDSLWRAAHQLHHSPPRVDLAGAFFTHPLEVILKVGLTGAVSFWLLGLTPLSAAMVALLSTLLSLWQHLNINTPHWLGYIIPRPESHVLHHERGVHARNYGDLPLWDMLFGTFFNPRSPWHGETGFSARASGRVRDMLLMRDASRQNDTSQ